MNNKVFSLTNLQKIMMLGILFWLQLVGVSKIFAEDIKIKYEYPTRLNLSRYHINRIHFESSKIKKVVGYKNLYSSILSHNKQDLYVRLNPEEVNPINISVIDTAGRVFDFELVQQERKAPLSVRVVQKREDAKLLDNISLESKKLIAAMRMGVADKYYVLKPEKRFTYGKLGRRVGVKIIKDYRYRNLRGLGIEVLNLSKKAIRVKPKKCANEFLGKIVSDSREELIIKPKGKEVIYLVIEKGEK
ncbi:MAG: type-F conjugative transfer system secretin TraK [Rickettsiaceae bacterium]|nr:type-F conjugative transfer system secretin TraK [Rickettsiaceae bacterium]